MGAGGGGGGGEHLEEEEEVGGGAEGGVGGDERVFVFRPCGPVRRSFLRYTWYMVLERTRYDIYTFRVPFLSRFVRVLYTILCSAWVFRRAAPLVTKLS